MEISRKRPCAPANRGSGDVEMRRPRRTRRAPCTRRRSGSRARIARTARGRSHGRGCRAFERAEVALDVPGGQRRRHRIRHVAARAESRSESGPCDTSACRELPVGATCGASLTLWAPAASGGRRVLQGYLLVDAGSVYFTTAPLLCLSLSHLCLSTPAARRVLPCWAVCVASCCTTRLTPFWSIVKSQSLAVTACSRSDELLFDDFTFVAACSSVTLLFEELRFVAAITDSGNVAASNASMRCLISGLLANVTCRYVTSSVSGVAPTMMSTHPRQLFASGVPT